MELPVVAGVDGSQGSLRALDWAVAEAAGRGLPLRIVNASVWEHYEGVRSGLAADRPSEQVYAETLVAMSQERARSLSAEVEVTTDIRPEEPVTALLEEADDAALLVLGSRGHGPVAGMLLGSVSLSVAARARCPVVVVRGRGPDAQQASRPGDGRVVLGVGDTAASGATARFAFREARSRGCELVAVRAWHGPRHPTVPHSPSDSDQLTAGRRQADRYVDTALAVGEGLAEVTVRRKVVPGTAHQTLLETAAPADLIVVGARRRHGAFGLQLGQVDHAMLHYAPCPVAIVPEREQGGAV
ncbi:universal stress protein [Streptomyces sp. NBC_01725]|uniref:universal stress protein n=1 Tax=Streptomyces sp. NBC_01725 TaxID=2975923 RepID=UPI002E284BC3|nr:universal stress protein [Streptomyces sp. NBC_01725]